MTGQQRHVRAAARLYRAITPSQPLATCPACGKYAYTSKAGAKRAGRRIYPQQKMRVYACPGTPWWHMTSQDAAQTTRRRDHRAYEAGAS